MSLHVPETSDQTVSSLIKEINSKGFACIPNFLREEDLQRMRDFVADALVKSGNQYVHFNGSEAVSGSGLEELAQSPAFEKLMHRLYEFSTGDPAYKDNYHQVLRCLVGTSGLKNSLIFHYDSYVVTALVPIEIPSEGKAGDLLIYPNTRKIRSFYLHNALDKVLLDNPVTQKVLRASFQSKALGPKRIKMIPGNMYFFWGYRSVHTNEPCDPDKVRATALFHYANPHRKPANGTAS